jgi:TetR/AcrR family transcriptional repressor of nem operon
MKISKEKAAENRDALVRAASRLICERGFDGVGVAEISTAAGLTHGALYAHFRSKEELALAALSYGLEQAGTRMEASPVDGTPDLAAFLDRYLSVASRDDYASVCPIAASASQLGRHDRDISNRVSEGYLEMVRIFEGSLATGGSGEAARARAMSLVATLIGVQAVARGAAKGNPALSEEVLRAARQVIGEAIGAH